MHLSKPSDGTAMRGGAVDVQSGDIDMPGKYSDSNLMRFRTRSNGHELKHGSFCLDRRKHVFTVRVTEH